MREGSPPGTTYYNNRRLELQLFAPEADISISKSNGLDEVSPASIVTYTVTATNSGPNGARATVSDILPVTLENSAWTCAGVAGGICAPSGAGDIADAVELPAGASVVYSIVTKVAMNASGTIENTATATVDAGINDPNLINNTATDTDTVKEKAIIPVASAKPVPSMSILAAGFLAMLIFSAALFFNKRRK
ncbi:MAG: DUF11 domain-containing protein [Comamonas sp.]